MSDTIPPRPVTPALPVLVAPVLLPEHPELQPLVDERIEALTDDECFDIGMQFRVFAETGEDLSDKVTASIVKFIAEREIAFGLRYSRHIEEEV